MTHLRDISKVDQALKSIMDASPMGAVVFNLDAQVIYANDLAEQLFGKSVDSLIGNRCGDFIGCHHRHTDPRGCGNSEHCPICPFYKAIQAILEGNTDPEVAKGEALVQRESDQPPIWFKFKASGIVLDSHKAVVMAMDDITKYKLDEAALQDRENRFRMMFMNAPMPYQSLDEQGNFIEVNQTFLDLLGYSPQELIGKNFGDILHPDWVDHFKHNFPKFKAIGEILGVEFEMVKKDGSTILVFFNGKIQRDEQGRFQRTHCIFQDITVHRQGEEALRDSELRFRTLADSGQALIWTSGLDKRCDYFNQPWLDFTGRTMAKELGDGWTEGVHPDDLARCVATYVRAFDRRERFSMDYRLRRHDGEFRWMQDDGSPRYDSRGVFLGFIGHCLDITERKQAEAKLRDSELFFRTTINSLKEHICVLDETGTIVLTNQAWNDFAIANSADPQCVWEGVNYLSVCDYSTGPELESASSCSRGIRAVLSGDSPEFIMEYPCHSPTEKRWFLGKVSPLQRKDSRWVVISHENITERKRAEDALRESERELRASQQIAHVGSWRLDVATNQVRWSEELYNMYGLDPALPPPPYTEHIKLFTPESWARLSTSLAKTRETGVAYELELKTVRKDGSNGWVWVRGEAARDLDGNIVGLWGAGHHRSQTSSGGTEGK
jgi:PAS domain S-box-containing protein